MLRTFQRGVMWAAVCAVSAGLASAQMGTFMGRVLGEDGKPVQGVIIKIERKDIKGNWQTKTNKRGEWVYSGMPIGGVFTISCEYNGQVMDVLNGDEPRPFWSTVTKMEAEYEKRIPQG